jgi:hypothetical protein
MLGVVNECAYLFDKYHILWYNIMVGREVFCVSVINQILTNVRYIRGVRYVRS